MKLVRSAAPVVFALANVACRKPTLGTVDVGTRTGPKGALFPTNHVEVAQFLGCDLRFENLVEGDEIKIEWRHKGEGSSDKSDWQTSKRETVKGTGNGTLHADLGSDTGEIDEGVWECNFHLFAANDRSVGTADVKGTIVVGKGDE